MSLTPDLEPVADVVIGSRIAYIMDMDDVSQTVMAKAMRMDQATLSRKLRGERKWTAAEIVRASKALRIRVAWIFGEALEARVDDAVRPKGLEPPTFWSGVWRPVRADWNDPTYRCARCGWPSWTWLCRVCADAVRTDDLALAA